MWGIYDADGRVLSIYVGSLPAEQTAAEGGVGYAEWPGGEQSAWLWADGWVEAPPPEPQPERIRPLTRVQFLLVAESAGYSEAGIEALITGDATLTEAERTGLLIRFHGAQLFPRDWPGLEAIAEDADLTPAQLDDLYRYGATL